MDAPWPILTEALRKHFCAAWDSSRTFSAGTPGSIRIKQLRSVPRVPHLVPWTMMPLDSASAFRRDTHLAS